MLTPERAVLFRTIFPAQPTDPDYIVEHVEASEFLEPVHQRLFIAMANAVTSQKVANITALGNALALLDPDASVLFYAVCAWPVELDDGGDVEALVDVFHEWSTRAKLAAVVRHAAEQLERNAPASAVRAEIEAGLTNLDLSAIDTRRYDDIAAQAEDIKAFLASDQEQGVGFGFAKLDENVPSMVPGNLVVIAGATGTGKSTVARNFARNWARDGHRVAIMSLEMSAREQWIALACMDTGIDLGAALTGTLEPTARAALWQAVKSWHNGSIRINERGLVTPEYLLRTLRRYRAEGFGLFIVDHLHRVEYGVRSEQQDLRLRVAALARSLKSFAMDTRAEVIVLAQLVKKPRSEEPNDSDIRETAQIAEEADKVFFVYRPDVAHERTLNGTLRPIDRDGVPGRRFYESDKAPAGSVLAPDDTRVFIKLGKQRIRPRSAIVSIPINAASGRMDDPVRRKTEAIAS